MDSLLVKGIRFSDASRKRPNSSRGPRVAVSEGGVSVYGRSVHAYAYIRMRLQVESLDFRYTRSVPAPPAMLNIGYRLSEGSKSLCEAGGSFEAW
jgi:hypothetical protein